MMRFALFAIVMMFTIPAHAQQSTREPLVITPGIGIGSVKLGMKIDDAIAVMGDATPEPLGSPYGGPVVIQRPLGALRYSWAKIVAQTNSQHVIYAIFTRHPEPMTAQGLHVGSDAAAVRSAMGEPSRVLSTSDWETLAYDSQGISFDIGNSQGMQYYRKVLEVGVFAPR